MKLRILKINFQSPQLKDMTIESFLDYMEMNFPDYNYISENFRNEEFNKLYPKIQFKIIDNQPTIIAAKKGIKVLRKVFPVIDKLKHIGDIEEESENKFYMYEEDIGISEEMINYKFASPWFPFYRINYEDYLHFQNDIPDEKFRNLGIRDLMRNMLIGCLYRMSKSMGYSINQKFHVESDFILPPPEKKDPATVSITGNFSMDFHIPSLLGLGNYVFRNKGVVVKNNDG
ncbi:MAG: CRISPR-associated endonuclease Cas6 [Candidatus Cloacimonadota bacterium]|nr:CRISPR-associated endonuclease Cas6 [Candidatus Cloacimonadota bacterium]